MNKTELLRHWRFRIHRVQIGHYEAGRLCEKRHLWLGIPAVILSTVVGTAVFVSLSDIAEKSTLIWLKILIGILSVAAAAFVSLQTFLRYSEQAEKHKIAGGKYAHLKHRVELLATLPPGTDEEIKNELITIEAEWDKVREESPNLPTSIWKRIENKMTFEDDLKTHSNFGTHA